MANADSTTSATNLELRELSNQIHDIAATLAGVSPSLLMLRDGVNNAENGNVLNLVGGMTDRLNREMCAIADKLYSLGEATA
jgi:hypothetical protein